MKFRISVQAAREIRGIGEYIARDNPDRANSFIEELHARVREIADRPLSFPSRADLAPDLRCALHRPYLILFRISDDAVEIIHVIHGARDVTQHL